MGEGSGLGDVGRLIRQDAELPASLRQEEIPLQHRPSVPLFFGYISDLCLLLFLFINLTQVLSICIRFFKEFVLAWLVISILYACFIFN